MKTILKYPARELDAIVEMTLAYNEYAREMGPDYVRASIERHVSEFADEELMFTGTMGYMILAIDQDFDQETDTRTVYLEFAFNASTYNTSKGVNNFEEYVELNLG